MPPLAWVGIGCGTILVILVIVVSLAVRACVDKVEEFRKNPEKAGAEMFVRMNPDLELVSQDENAGTMTVRVKKSGETVT